MYTYVNSQRRWHMGNTLEVVFLLLLNIVVNIIIGTFFRYKEHEARDAP